MKALRSLLDRFRELVKSLSVRNLAAAWVFALGIAVSNPVLGQSGSTSVFRPSGVNILDIPVPEEERLYPWLHGIELVMDPAETVAPADFEAWFRANSELDLNSKLESVQAPRPVSQGLEFVRLEHWFKGLRVLGEEVLLMVRDGRVTSAVAKIRPSFGIDPDAALGEPIDGRARVATVTITTQMVSPNRVYRQEDHVRP